MVPDSPLIPLIFLLGYAILGMAIGAVSGWLTHAVTKAVSRQILADAVTEKPSKRVLPDALAGLLGCFGGLMTASLPWHQNTITYRLSGGTIVSQTADYFQYYERAAIIAAILLPCLYEFGRFFRARRSRSR